MRFCSRAPSAFEDLPVRGGWEADCSVPDSAARRWHGCCRPVRWSGDKFNHMGHSWASISSGSASTTDFMTSNFVWICSESETAACVPKQLPTVQKVEFSFTSDPFEGDFTPHSSAECAAGWPLSTQHTPADVSNKQNKFKIKISMFHGNKNRLLQRNGRNQKWSEKCRCRQSAKEGRRSLKVLVLADKTKYILWTAG